MASAKVVVLIIETQCKNDTEAVIHRAYNKLITRRIIAKREIKCDRDEYNLGDECCKKCESGFVKNTSCPKNTAEHCVPCEKGKEYVEHANDLDKCLRCESGLIEKQCTSTSDTVCRMKDVDLSSHVAGIVEEMTLQEVKTFVRNHKVPEPVIDQTVRDYFSDTSEQKIKLFQVWYQRHGIKGAYGTLISSLREFKMCTAADKIEEKLKAALSSYQEEGQSYNDDTEQSKTCTQEGRNSYNDSAELSKTSSGSLEEA
ncbi:hypothetical protein QYF61_007860 [Mycteria americana]|uniref:Tumor necrosis factor receptor superfamily member 6 n=1 Tax=Mycteria americana TaxID=33587 RepID=A0AAN7NRZ6_MYCAM|nr:hypothetical protein QYF61_007860 [Mycteria americana]